MRRTVLAVAAAAAIATAAGLSVASFAYAVFLLLQNLGLTAWGAAILVGAVLLAILIALAAWGHRAERLPVEAAPYSEAAPAPHPAAAMVGDFVRACPMTALALGAVAAVVAARRPALLRELSSLLNVKM